ncbi:MAG: hypothetical protein KDB13_00665 [Microthrixaceae bacterium]|nr:hypothetical protein [Microthrixaceae bacterium]
MGRTYDDLPVGIQSQNPVDFAPLAVRALFTKWGMRRRAPAADTPGAAGRRARLWE